MKEKKIALHHLHEKLGAKMMLFAGYMMPLRYGSEIEEHKCVRKNVGIFDVSHMGEFLISGKHAVDLLQKITSNDVSKLEVGKAQYSYMPNLEGGIIDDLIIYQIKNEQYMMVVNASNIEKDFDWVNSHNNMGAEIKNISDDFSLFSVQGPKASKLLQSLTSVDLSKIKYYNFVVGDLAGVEHLIISATGYTGAGGFELYLHNHHAEKVWNKILEVGEKFDIKPIGLAARDTLRLEMGYCLYGNDIDETTSPFEAGLGWVTKFSKQFINAEMLKNKKEEGIKKKLIGFKMIEQGIPRKNYDILTFEEKIIGKVTSGGISPILSQGIGMGYINKEYAVEGKNILISIRKKNLKAVVCKFPIINKQ